MKKQSKTFKKGFTLTEMLVVVLIVAVLAAVVYPLYTKSITKSRAVEAINLLEMVRNKQIQNYAREREYFTEFTSMGQLTGNVQGEQALSGGSQLKVKDYTLSLNNATKCMSAKYQKGASSFTFSTSYENAGLGCTGSICTSFGDIIGDAKSVCNCGSKTCDNGYTLNEDTCNCDCLMSCDQGGKCYDPYGGGLTRPCSSGCGTESSTGSCGGSIWSGKCWSITQEQATSQGCGWNNSGNQTRTCSATCNKGSCGAWGPCRNQDCDPSKKPPTTQKCGNNNTGTQSRTVTCNPDTGGWETGPWGPCSGQVCSDSQKPSLSQGCGNCGYQTRTVSCNSDTGNWNAPSSWGTCTGQGSCSPGSSRSCGSGGTQSCNSSCSWGSCTGESYSCSGNSSQSCGKCGTQTRTCDTSNGTWGSWGYCSGEGECSYGSSQSCGGGNGTQTCSASCSWKSCACKEGYTWNGSTCVKSSYDCPSYSKPSTSQSCGKCGNQTRSVTCDTSKGTWQEGSWGSCSGEGACTSGATQSCGGGNGTQRCSNSCAWESCVCKSGYTWNGSTCVIVANCNDRSYKISHKSECCPRMSTSDTDCYKEEIYAFRSQGSVATDANTSCSGSALNPPSYYGSQDKCMYYLGGVKYRYQSVQRLSAGGCSGDSCRCSKSAAGSIGYTSCSNFWYTGGLSGGVCGAYIDLHKCVLVQAASRNGW